MAPRPWLPLALAGAALACGGTSSAPPPAPATPDVAPFDCSAFEARLAECEGEFTLAFGRTKRAELVVGDTPEQKADSIRSALKMQRSLGQSPCDAPAWGDLSNKDPQWQVRYAACDPTAPCAAWGDCVGKALGAPMVY